MGFGINYFFTGFAPGGYFTRKLYVQNAIPRPDRTEFEVFIFLRRAGEGVISRFARASPFMRTRRAGSADMHYFADE